MIFLVLGLGFIAVVVTAVALLVKEGEEYLDQMEYENEIEHDDEEG